MGLLNSNFHTFVARLVGNSTQFQTIPNLVGVLLSPFVIFVKYCTINYILITWHDDPKIECIYIYLYTQYDIYIYTYGMIYIHIYILCDSWHGWFNMVPALCIAQEVWDGNTGPPSDAAWVMEIQGAEHVA